MLAFHANITLASPTYLGRDVFPAMNAGYSGVHFFFVLSGFVILLAHADDIGRPERLGYYAWKRLVRVFPPLWVVLTCVVIASRFMPSANIEPTWPNIVWAFAALPSIREPLLSVEWTLRHEVLFYAAVATIIVNRRAGALVLAVWLGMSILTEPRADTWGFVFSPHHLLFAMGLTAAVIFRRGCGASLGGCAMLIGIAVFATTWLQATWSELDEATLQSDTPTNLSFGIGAMLIILGMSALEREGRLGVPRWLAFFGEASYAIYLVHFPVISVACRMTTGLDRNLGEGLVFALVAGTAAIAGIVFHVAVERPMLSLLARVPIARRDGRSRKR